jgi:hypothetical protein
VRQCEKQRAENKNLIACPELDSGSRLWEGLWEQLNNPNFKSIEFDAFRNESGSNSFTLTPKKWIESTKHQHFYISNNS